MNQRNPSPTGSGHTIVGHLGPTRLATTSVWTGMVVLGLLLVGASMPSTWTERHVFGDERNATEVPIGFMWDPTPASLDAPPILWPLLGAIALALLGLIFTSGRWAIVVAGLASIAIPVATLLAVRSRLDDPRIRTGAELFDSLGPGVWLAMAGGIALALGGSMALRRLR